MGHLSWAEFTSSAITNDKLQMTNVAHRPTASRSPSASCGASLLRRRDSGVSGMRSSPVSRPSICMAALIGIGLVDRPSMSRQSGKSLWCQRRASAMSPASKARDQGDHVLGHDVADDRDHAAAADRHQRQRQAVVAAEGRSGRSRR